MLTLSLFTSLKKSLFFLAELARFIFPLFPSTLEKKEKMNGTGSSTKKNRPMAMPHSRM